MRILHYKSTMRLEDGGVVKAVLDLVTLGVQIGEVGLATLDPACVPEGWRPGGQVPVSVHHITGGPGRAGRLARPQLAQLREIISGYDVVHLHSMWTPKNVQVAAICASLGKPYILSVHGMLDDWCMSQRRLKKVVYLKTLGRRLLPGARVVLCTAQAELDQASAWFDKRKGVSIPLPFDLGEYETVPPAELAYESFEGLDRDRPKVLFLSRIHYKKGVDRLIEASALLASRGVDHQLVIAGTGDEPYVRQMKELARAKGIEDRVYFLGFASGAAKVALFGACDVFALATSQENFGFVYFESLAAGTPVLTTRGTDTWPELEQSGGGVIVENTPSAFADELARLLAGPERLAEMGGSGRAWVRDFMSPERVRGMYRDLYSSLC